MKKTKIKQRAVLSNGAVRLFKVLLAPITLALIYTAAYASSLDTYDAARFYPVLASQMEHILMSLLLTVGGTLAYDLKVKGL